MRGSGLMMLAVLQLALDGDHALARSSGPRRAPRAPRGCTAASARRSTGRPPGASCPRRTGSTSPPQLPAHRAAHRAADHSAHHAAFDAALDAALSSLGCARRSSFSGSASGGFSCGISFGWTMASGFLITFFSWCSVFVRRPEEEAGRGRRRRQRGEELHLRLLLRLSGTGARRARATRRDAARTCTTIEMIVPTPMRLSGDVSPVQDGVEHWLKALLIRSPPDVDC